MTGGRPGITQEHASHGMAHFWSSGRRAGQAMGPRNHDDRGTAGSCAGYNGEVGSRLPHGRALTYPCILAGRVKTSVIFDFGRRFSRTAGQGRARWWNEAA